MSTDNAPTVEAGEWYWDWRLDKAYYARNCDDDKVQLVSVWHRDEMESALQEGAVTPIDEITEDDRAPIYRLKESFRVPDDEQIDRSFEEGDE